MAFWRLASVLLEMVVNATSLEPAPNQKKPKCHVVGILGFSWLGGVDDFQFLFVLQTPEYVIVGNNFLYFLQLHSSNYCCIASL
jgi:hypothetical protein